MKNILECKWRHSHLAAFSYTNLDQLLERGLPSLVLVIQHPGDYEEVLAYFAVVGKSVPVCRSHAEAPINKTPMVPIH